MELDSATQKLAADTGLSGQALADQAKSISALYGNSLQSMGDVEHALSMEISAYKLTGQAAADAALGVIKYEEATGQGAAAIDTLKEITDVYNLSAADQGHLMDLLVASHQKYSTNVGASQAALLAMGPALSGMNLSLDDGVALLNLFETAGIDASKAPMALQKAIKALKPGETFNDLIVQISSIVDPTQRAQEAMKIFGARGGAQMAQALQPGITSLDQFATSAADTAGASTKAADAIESSWTNVATKIIHTIEGPLAEIGQSIMPLMLVGSLFGPKVLALVGGAAGLLGSTTGGAVVAGEAATVAAGGPAVAGAMAAQGTEVAAAGIGLGTIAGAAFAGALLLGIGAAAIAPALIGLKSELDKNNAMAEQGLTEAEIRAVKWKQMSDNERRLATMHGFGKPENYEADIKSAQAKLDAAQLAQKQADAPGLFEADNSIAAMEATILASKKDIIARAVKDGYSGVPDAIEASQYEAKLALLKGLDDQVAAIKSKKSAFTGAWSDALDASAGPASRALAEYQLRCQMVSTTLLDDLKSNDATTKKMAELQLQVYQDQYAKMMADEANFGTDSERVTKLNALLQSKAYKDGLKSTDEETAALWAKVGADTQQTLAQLTGSDGSMSKVGSDAMDAYAAAVRAAMPATQRALWEAMMPQWAPTPYNGGYTLPTAPTAPVTTPKDSRPYMENGGFLAPDHSAYSGESGIERLDALAGGGVMVTPMGTGAGRTTQVYVQGLLRAETPEDVARVLRRAEAF